MIEIYLKHRQGRIWASWIIGSCKYSNVFDSIEIARDYFMGLYNRPVLIER